MVGWAGMMRGVKNKVVDAGKKVIDQGKQSAGDLAGQVAQDVLLGQNVNDSIRKRSIEQKRKLYAGVTPTISHIRQSTARALSQSGQGKRRATRPRKTTTSTKKKKKKRTARRDIFDDDDA